MNVKKLCLTNYRNCSDLELSFNTEKNLIIGKNAQGKTNILESIYFLSCLKSQRTTNQTELIKFNNNSFNIRADILKSGVDIELAYSYTSDKKRNISLNGLKTNIKNFKSTLKTVLFSTSDLMLLRGAPQDRRTWLDNAIGQVYPTYDERLSKYEKIRVQKNNYLKECAKNGTFNKNLLDVFNEQLSITGSNIIYIRNKYLKEIEQIAKTKHSLISNDEILSVKYDCNFLDKSYEYTTIQDLQTIFLNSLQESEIEERRRCQSVIGPHRDDILFFINDNDAVKFASQGQQRTIVLALKLSELDIITHKTGDTPILLLDDVLAELDDLRQNYLLKSIDKNTQTIITSVDTVLFEEEFLKDVKIFKIENGKILSTLNS